MTSGQPTPLGVPAHSRSSPDETTLAGYVERVTFHNADTGFCVFRVRARGHRGEVTVVGTVPDVNAGEWIEARGTWVMDPVHGRQFSAEEIHLSPPETLEGIERYLGSGLIHGIGPVHARRLVEKFGRDVFDIIEKQSARLLEVEGIGPVRRERIRAAWEEQKAIRTIMTFLLSHGVSPARALRIYKVYGDRAIERIRMDPYGLARDIRGIGFPSADKIAQRLGISPDSLLRARAALVHVLKELAEQGHCAWPQEALIQHTAETLNIPEDRLRTALDEELRDRRLVLRPSPEGVPLVYLPELDAAERELAERIRRLQLGEHPLSNANLSEWISRVELRLGFTLAPEQREALKLVCRSKVAVVTGGPGVGKTTLVRAIVLVARAHRLRLALCAPTGRAAQRLSEVSGLPAKTIHRLLIYDPSTGGFRHSASNPLPADWVIVDESSMFDVVLAAQLVRAVAPTSAMLFVGDVDQLPSVGPGMVLRDLIDSGRIPTARLTKIFRQSARSHIVANAHRIREGRPPVVPTFARDERGDFYFIEAEEPAAAVDRIVRLVRDRIPRHFGLDPVSDVQVLTPMQRGELGARHLNEVLQQALNPSGMEIERFGVRYRMGDKVMQVENDYDKEVFNGDIGRIVEVRPDCREVVVRFEGRLVTYHALELDELVPAYAITIHKSQGCEYPCVVVVLHTQQYVMLQRNLLYTAVTRGRRVVILVGSRRAVAMAVRRVDSHQRVTLLREWIRSGPPAAEPAAPHDLWARPTSWADDVEPERRFQHSDTKLKGDEP